tara:strand:+ start:35 stop:496 length:462 start_codon:yes stop_codon:yes gene_type:complete
MAVTLDDVFNLLGEKIVADIKQQLNSTDPKKFASGTLINQMTYQYKDKQLIIKSPGAEKYQSIVNFGRNAGKYPKRGVIEDWIKIKNLQPKYKNVRQRDLPFLIKRKIKEQGIPGINFTGNTFLKFGPIIGESIGLKYQEELNRIINELKAII